MTVVEGGLAREDDEPSSEPDDRFLSAFSLIDSASHAIELLEARRDALESALGEMSNRLEAAAAASAGRILEAQRAAGEQQRRNAELERQLAALRQRVQLAEAERDAQRERADAADQRAVEAQQLLRALHAKVMSALGRGTRAYDILAAVPAIEMEADEAQA